MSVTLIVQILEALANTVSALAPLVIEGEQVLSASDTASVHAALAKAQAATAGLRGPVDDALAKAAAT